MTGAIGLVTLTAEMIHAAKNGQGGWNRRQVAALGVPWPLTAGWVGRLVGTRVGEAAYREFVALRHEPGDAKRRKAVAKRKYQALRAVEGLAELGAVDALVELAREIGRGIAGHYDDGCRAASAIRADGRPPASSPDPSTVCPGHGPHGTGPKCCDRIGEYNGYGSDGPTLFTCPAHCSCHD